LKPVGESRLKSEASLKRAAKGARDEIRVVAEKVRHVTLPEVKDTVPILVFHPGSVRSNDPRGERLDQAQGVTSPIDLGPLGTFVQHGGLRRVRSVGSREVLNQAGMVLPTQTQLLHSQFLHRFDPPIPCETRARGPLV
jgi:hypothetical protein